MKKRHDRRLFAGMVADLADLHLSDKFIDLLKTRRLTRPIRNLNAWIDTARVKSWRIVGRESMMEPLLC